MQLVADHYHPARLSVRDVGSLSFSLHWQASHAVPLSRGYSPKQYDLDDPSSIEMHPDGTIYVAYSPRLSPIWYDTEAANDGGNPRIRTGAGYGNFQDVKKKNVLESNWVSPTGAFPEGWRPTPRWFTIFLPPTSPCDPDTGCTPRNPSEWLSFLRSGSPEVERLIRHETTPLPDSGAFCYRDTWSPVNIGGPPEWQTILPVNADGKVNGQRTSNPDLPDNAALNHYVYWEELMEMMQNDPDRGKIVLQYRGHPDYGDHRVPWISSSVEGIVTNSFASGEDYAGTHRDWPGGYWLGTPEPPHPEGCGTFAAKNALCNDWDIFLRPDPEYRFLLAHDRPGHDGNFDGEHQGNLENEVEQWLIPGGFRPQPGNRIFMTGRWIIDCGHDDWHAELHPIESFVSSHLQPRQAAPMQAVATVVVTGAWQGGQLDLDIWPPIRLSATARLQKTQDSSDSNVTQGLTVHETLLPADNPNHLHLTITAPYETLRTDTSNDLYYNTTRRFANKYRLWWE